MPSAQVSDSSLLSAQSEYEETKIKILGDIRISMESVLSRVVTITDTMVKGLVIAQDQAKKSKLLASDATESKRESKQPNAESKTLKETMNEGKGFWTLITAFFIPAIIGFVDALFDLSEPFGLLKGAVTGLLLFFASRSLLSLIAGSIKIMVSKIGASILASLASSKLGQKISGLFGKTPVISPVSSVKSPVEIDKRGRTLPSRDASGKFAGKQSGMKSFGAGLQAIAKGAAAFVGPAGLGLAILTAAAMGLGKALEYAAPAIKEFAPVLIKIADVIGNVVVTAIKEFFAVVKEVVAILPEAFQSIGNVISSVFGGIADVIESIGNTIATVLTSIKNLFVDSLLTLNQLDGEQLGEAAWGITKLAGALTLLTARNLVDGLLSLLSSDPLGKLVKLGNVAPNIVELAEVMADFGNIVEFFNESLNNLDGDAAIKQFKMMRDGIEMIGEALDKVSMVKLVAFTALSKLSAPKLGAPDTISSMSNNVSEAADRASGYSYNKESISGTLRMGMAHGPITYNGEVFYPDDEEYPDLARKLQSQSSLSIRGRSPQAEGTGVGRTSMMGELTSSVNNARTSSGSQSPQMMSVNNVNSVNKSETNYKSTSMGAALQGDALRYVY
jgi:hypothetical protein